MLDVLERTSLSDKRDIKDNLELWKIALKETDKNIFFYVKTFQFR